jgi:conjugal transfer pilin signal peptidase TrbI
MAISHFLQLRIKFFAKGILLTALFTSPGVWFFQTHSIGIDTQAETCLPFRVYLYSKVGDEPLKPGDYVSFHMDERGSPFFHNGQTFIKKVAASAGDTIEIKGGFVYINGKAVKAVSKHNAEKMRKQIKDFDRKLTLKEGEYWAMASHPNSFDSTYWGVLHQSQIIGKAFPIY